MSETTDMKTVAKQITTCNFMLAPMTDRYEEVIMGAVLKVDTGRVWSATGKLGTTYRGDRKDVIDALMACFTYAYKPDVHMTLTMTLSNGCPCDTPEHYVLSDKTGLANLEGYKDIHFPVDCKFAVYPLGKEDYIDDIWAIIDLAKEMGVYNEVVHSATTLKGDVQDLFAYFSQALAYCEEKVSHAVFEITMSVNSPTVE